MARGRRRVRDGRVISDRMDKSIMVEVETLRRHPRYERVVRRRQRFMAHDEENTCHVGDLVRIEESRPLSRRKRWRLIEVIARAGERRGAVLPPAAAETELILPIAEEEEAAEPVAEAETQADEESAEAVAQAGTDGDAEADEESVEAVAQTGTDGDAEADEEPVEAVAQAEIDSEADAKVESAEADAEAEAASDEPEPKE